MSKAIIVGGTGTLGQAMTKALLKKGFEVTVFSRSEHKQHEMKRTFPQCRYIIGDARDFSSLDKAMHGHDICFAFHAMKHVDICELHPEESIKTNIMGNINIRDAVLKHQVPFCVFSSTDKAVDPINVYGNCKAIAEKIMMQANGRGTLFTNFRWGNILNSNGSIIPIFIKKLKNREPVQLTHPEMTRFFLKIETAVNFILENYWIPNSDCYFPSCKSAKIVDVINTLGLILDVEPVIEVVGLRPGEKLHEVLRSAHSEKGAISSNDTANFLTEGELIDLLEELV